MEKGQMRVEVNISISKNDKLGTKVEIKNLNSFKVVEKAVDFEIKRQEEVLESGEKVVQETRGWHDKKEITFSQREKEEAHDYRYFPEPDLPSMHFDEDYIINIKSTMPELPEQKRERFKKEYGLDEKSVEFFVANKDLSEYYEKVVSEFEEWLETERGKDNIKEGEEKKIFKLVANYLISDLQGLLAGREFIEAEFKITSENFAEFVKMIYRGEISSKVAKMVVEDMFNTGSDPSSIVDENNWRQMSDDSGLEKIISEVISKNAKAAEDYKKGKSASLQFLAGQVMAATRGTAKPEKVQELLKKLL
jgi:aspartyl-tRNA(Asn)/glutamyl-tRNA(Gln) amidotransferase subunit B